MIRRLLQYAFWAWCILLSGCTVYQNARRTMCEEPAAYSWKHDRRKSVRAYRELADQAWQEEALACPELFGYPDYVAGFRDGFVDYVYAGGTGEPPPVPPRPFWNVALRTPDGKDRTHQWFDGYRHGARVARDGGYRDLGIVHSSVFGLEEPPYTEYASEAMSPFRSEPDAFLPDADFDPHAEVLPEPEDAPALAPPVQVPDNEDENAEIPEDASNGDDEPQDTTLPQDEAGVDQDEAPAIDQSDENPAQERAVESLPAEPISDQPPQGELPVAEEPSAEPAAAEPPSDPPPAAAPQSSSSTPETGSPVPFAAAEGVRGVPTVTRRIQTPPREMTGPRPVGSSANSTLRIMTEPQLMGLNDTPHEKQPATLVKTSFVVKAPLQKADPWRARGESAPAPTAHPGDKHVSTPSTSTITIRKPESPPAEPRIPIRNQREAVFLR